MNFKDCETIDDLGHFICFQKGVIDELRNEVADVRKGREVVRDAKHYYKEEAIKARAERDKLEKEISELKSSAITNKAVHRSVENAYNRISEEMEELNRQYGDRDCLDRLEKKNAELEDRLENLSDTNVIVRMVENGDAWKIKEIMEIEGS